MVFVKLGILRNFLWKNTTANRDKSGKKLWLTKEGRAARMEKNVTKKRIVRIGNVTERGPRVEGPYGKYSEPASESCVRSTA